MSSTPPTPSTSPSPATATGEHAISEYPDVDAVVERCDALVAQPPRPLRRDRMDAYLGWFDERCAGSKAAAAEARRFIPGGVQHNLAFNHPFPLEVTRAEGAHLWDVDGNRYVDFLQAGGPTVLGSNYAPVREQVVDLLASCGPVTGLFHDYEVRLARLVHDLMPAVEQFRMLGSGTESVMAALRAARAFTGHEHVVKVVPATTAGATRSSTRCACRAPPTSTPPGSPATCWPAPTRSGPTTWATSRPRWPPTSSGAAPRR
jgi:glutamate-1-semialdehyde 2,1-aminomutase